MATKKPVRKTWGDEKPTPKQVPLGTGMADKAKQAVAGRRQRLDDMVDEAVSGKKKKKN
jgi:hypothetical protein